MNNTCRRSVREDLPTDCTGRLSNGDPVTRNQYVNCVYGASVFWAPARFSSHRSAAVDGQCLAQRPRSTCSGVGSFPAPGRRDRSGARPHHSRCQPHVRHQYVTHQ
ncbi:hypothetical protein AAFF_G00305730 [Aldrovandia affinis]|uniref:Uncharacterized protein n=1 Tax=Aldrovandia affinis TaxID=143900 RepID=A0AAD7SQM3_9TELE|nr:hypothetical protein AAFF_G00305730 [Aldrovandia affinis]